MPRKNDDVADTADPSQRRQPYPKVRAICGKRNTAQNALATPRERRETLSPLNDSSLIFFLSRRMILTTKNVATKPPPCTN